MTLCLVFLDTPLFVLTNKQFFYFLDACCFQFAYWTTERWQKRSQYTYYNGLQGEFFIAFCSFSIVPAWALYQIVIFSRDGLNFFAFFVF